MSLRILHTADWQLGKPFASVRDEAKRHRLQQERIQAIHCLAALVRDKEAGLVVVAGDMFDSPHVTKATVSAACAAIGALQVPVLVIPGNHDHGGPGSLWEQEFFQREQRQLAPNLRVLLQSEPVVLNEVVIFPAPLRHRHQSGSPIAWIRTAFADPALPADRPRLVLAHGTVQGFTATQEDEEDGPVTANWIDLTSLPEEELDYIALGDWHGTKQVGPKAWYSGTPETDRFPKGEGNDPGHVLLTTLARGQAPVVEKIRTARLEWQEMTFRFHDDASLEALTSQLDQLIGGRSDEFLLRLTLEGSLGLSASSRLEKILESWEARLLRLKLDNQVTLAPSDDELATLSQRSQDPLISTVASELVARTQSGGDDAETARVALRELYALLS